MSISSVTSATVTATTTMRPSRRTKPGNSSSKQKNVREAYLQYVKNNNSFTMGSKSKSITNLENYESSLASSSAYLEDQFSLVKQILNATNALEKLRNPSRDASVNRRSHGVQSGTPAYKSQEEYYEEVMELKKTLKKMDNNETILKAKCEHYQNELNKKTQEFENLIDSQGLVDSHRSTAGSAKVQVLNLKKKLFKLELQLKKKDGELQKLSGDLKTTNEREMRIINENLRQEILRLNECLINSNILSTRFEQQVAQRNEKTKNGAISVSSEDRHRSDEYEHQIKTLQDLNAKLKTDNEKLNEELSVSGKPKLNSQTENIYKKQIENLTESCHHYKQLCNEKDGELDKLRKEIDELKDKLKDMRTTVYNERNQDNHGRSPSHSRHNTSMESVRRAKSPAMQNTSQKNLHDLMSSDRASPSLSRASSRTNLKDKKHDDDDVHGNGEDKLFNRLDKKLETANAINTIQNVFRAHSQRLKFCDEYSASTIQKQRTQSNSNDNEYGTKSRSKSPKFNDNSFNRRKSPLNRSSRDDDIFMD